MGTISFLGRRCGSHNKTSKKAEKLISIKKMVSYLQVSTDPITGCLEKYVKGDNSIISLMTQYNYH
jgi:hypothetical protein